MRGGGTGAIIARRNFSYASTDSVTWTGPRARLDHDVQATAAMVAIGSGSSQTSQAGMSSFPNVALGGGQPNCRPGMPGFYGNPTHSCSPSTKT